MAAPSAANRKPWHFVAVTDAGVRAKLAAVHPHAQMVLLSPLTIVPCGETGRGPGDSGGIKKSPPAVRRAPGSGSWKVRYGLLPTSKEGSRAWIESMSSSIV